MISIEEKKTTINLSSGWCCSSTDGHNWDYLYKGADIKKSTEKPAFRVIEGIEDAYVDEFSKMAIRMVKDIAKYLKG